MESAAASAVASDIGRKLIDIYFKTNPYPYTRHHIDSYDQFLQKDLQLVIKSQNPIIILKDLIPNTNQYKYRVEINVGGADASGIYTKKRRKGKRRRQLQMKTKRRHN